ncbi:MAG: hypothetical protein SVY10_03540 [Thermodesulfobacteriota bacterium]|nr:hypothetical protein [Thermodesulfobacteriota bacterium]
MKNLGIILVCLMVASCTVDNSTSETKRPKTSGKTITVMASIFPELKERQGSFKMRGLNGEWIDGPPPMKPTGKLHVTFAHQEKLPVFLPWPGQQPPMKLYKNLKATVLIEKEGGKAAYSILKLEHDGETIYQKEPNDS